MGDNEMSNESIDRKTNTKSTSPLTITLGLEKFQMHQPVSVFMKPNFFYKQISCYSDRKCGTAFK